MIRTLSPRAQEILTALEREAAARRLDAQLGLQPPATLPQAAEPVDEGGPAPDLPTLVGAALARTELARQRLSVLAEAVDEFAGRLGVAKGGSRPESAPPVRPAPAEAPDPEPGGAFDPEPGGAFDPEPAEAPYPMPARSPAQAGGRRISNRAARRLAVDMATEGASRDAVGDRLRSFYGVPDPSQTLDLVFGVEPVAPEEPLAEPVPPLREQSPSFEVTDLSRHLLPGIDESPLPHLPAVPPEAASGSTAPAHADAQRHSPGSMLRLAVDLAAAGESRGSVGDWLRSLYGIPDSTSTLDAVFGVGTMDEDRSTLHYEATPGRSGAERPVTAEELLATRSATVRSSAVREGESAAVKEHGVGASPVKRSPSFEVIDLHHHLLPGIDDGPSTLVDALALARAAVAAGTNTVIATPHVSRGHPANTAASIADGVAALEEALAGASIPLRVLPGAEVAVTHTVDLSDEELTALRLGSGPYLLVECPLTPTTDDLELLLEALLERGHRILLAHPERCHAFQRDPGLMARLVSRGVLSQITAGSLTGSFGRTVREVAHRFVRDGLVHVVASDAHSADRRPPALLADVQKEGYAEQAACLVGLIPRAILEGGPLPLMPALPPLPRSGLKRLLGR